MRRVSFTGEDLWRFSSLDQLHARLLFPPKDAAAPEWPRLDDEGGMLWPGGRQKIGSRVYTIRTVDAVAGTMAIDIVLHPTAVGLESNGCGQPGLATSSASSVPPPMA